MLESVGLEGGGQGEQWGRSWASENPEHFQPKAKTFDRHTLRSCFCL